MADKGKKGKPGAAAPPPAKAPPPPAGAPPPADAKPGDEKGDTKGEEVLPKVKSVQPKDQVGTRKGCRRYKWELKDSNREFWVMGHGEVKILSLGCLAAALILFTGTTVHPLLTLVITMELSIFCFFIIVHTFAIQRFMPFVLWPITDILNDLFAAIFLAGAVALAVQTRQTMPVNYIVAVVLIGFAAFFPLIDICLQRKHFRGKKLQRNVLVPPEKKGKGKPESPAQGKEEEKAPGAGKPKEEGKPKDKADKGDKGKKGKK